MERSQKSPNGLPLARRGTPKMVRRETDDDLLQGAMLHAGHIKLNVLLRIRHFETGQMNGWHGTSLMLKAPTKEAALAFREKFAGALVRLAEECGMSVPSKIIVER